MHTEYAKDLVTKYITTKKERRIIVLSFRLDVEEIQYTIRLCNDHVANH